MSAGLLHAAAAKLRETTAAVRHEIEINPYWHGVPGEDAWALGVKNALGGPAGDAAAMFGPDFTDTLAGWLDREAEIWEQCETSKVEWNAKGYKLSWGISTHEQALTTARAILGEVTE